MVNSAVTYGILSPIRTIWLIERFGFEQSFDAAGVNLLAVGGNDQFLLAAGDVDVAVGVDLGDIAGVQPAVLQYRRGGVRILVISGEERGPLDQQFAIVGEARLRRPGAPFRCCRLWDGPADSDAATPPSVSP